MAQAPATEFSIEWLDPEDAQRTWVWDGQHNPYPLTPLSIEFTERIFLRTGDAFGQGPHERVRSIWPHGYLYRMMPGPRGAAGGDRATAARQRLVAHEAQDVLRIWRRDHLPEVRATCRALQEHDYASMPLARLASRIDGLIHSGAGAFAHTLRVAPAMFECSRPFIDFCAEEFDAEGERMAASVMQGFANESSAAELALWEVAEIARARPAVARALTEGGIDSFPESLRGVRGRVAFTEALDRYLDRYGWRSDFWFELSSPTWREDPRPALRSLRRYITGEAPSPQQAHARAARRRGQAVRRARAALERSPKKLEWFNRLLRTAQQHVPLSEERALWQLTLGGSLHAACVALGQKLVRASVCDEAGDVFHLHVAEIRELAAGSGSPDWRSLVATRRAERERAMAMIPPRTIGASFDPSTRLPTEDRFSGAVGGDTDADGRVLSGAAASAGVVRARARVARTLDEANGVEPGEILVCRSTSPAWTPLFARVAAVVTEFGGVLSHSAIVAREYAIPCVAGVPGASERIRDGMLITVDGGQGLVRLEQ